MRIAITVDYAEHNAEDQVGEVIGLADDPGFDDITITNYLIGCGMEAEEIAEALDGKGWFAIVYREVA